MLTAKARSSHLLAVLLAAAAALFLLTDSETNAQTAVTSTPTPSKTAAPALSIPALRADATAHGVTLRWEPVPQAARYELLTWWNEDTGWQPIGGDNLTGTSYTHTDVAAGTTYFYSIRALNAAGGASPWLLDYPTATALAAQTAATSTPTPTPTGTPISTPTPSGPALERAALVALYNATGGAGWNNNTNWLSSAPVGTWNGVFTNDNGHVTELRLSENGLRGSIPDLSALNSLGDLRLENNALSGQIPDLRSLTKLRVLDLSDNALSGQIPDLRSLTKLRVLDLRYNQLSGPIPDLGKLTSLRDLYLSDNQLTGPIPDLSALHILWDVNLSYNRLTGPVQVQRLPPNLLDLQLGYNRLTGPIPDLSAHTRLRYLGLASNQLTGTIPDLSAFTRMRDLALGGNELTGKIPDLSALTELRSLSLDDNQLTGTIPDLSEHTGLTYLRLNNNQLTGTIPDLSKLTKLTGLLLSYNQLSGPILNVNHLTNLSSLSLRYNRFTGPVPDLSALKSLTWLTLRGNRLCLPQNFDRSGVNKVVTDHLDSLSLPVCSAADLSLTLGPPANVTPAIGDGVVTLTWGAVPNVAGYELRVWDSIDREWGRIGGGLLSATTYTHPVLKDGRNYYFQVRAVGLNGLRGAWSEQAYAAVVAPRFPPPPASLGVEMQYQKYTQIGGVSVVAPSEVSDEKLVRARGIINGILGGRNDLLRELAANRTVIFMESYNTRGIAYKSSDGWEAYVRAYDSYCGNFIHEFAHLVHYALEDQPDGQAFNNRLQDLYQAALSAGLWQGLYASRNAAEYWAEAVKHWFWGFSPRSYTERLADYDAGISSLIEEVFGETAAVPPSCDR